MTNVSYTLVFGLTADPIHKGHEQVILNSFAYAKTKKFNIKEFLLVPTYQPNLVANKQQPKTSYKHRFKMCELTAQDIIKKFNYPAYVSDIEKQLYKKYNKKSYSYDTLKAIEARHKLFVVSADHFAGRWPKFRKWYNWQDLVKENGLLIHQRPGHGINTSFIEQLKEINADVFVAADMPSVDVSSTQIRSMFQNRNSISSNLISPFIGKYCLSKQLYR